MKPIFSILLLLGLSANAQTIGQVYQSYINDAELLLTVNKYNDALLKYEEAFKSTKVEFTIDIYNACVCAVKLKKDSKVLEFSDKLALKGVGEKFFGRNIFNSYRSNKNFRKILARAEERKREYVIANKKYEDDIAVFFKLDSTYTHLRHTTYRDYDKIPDTLQNLYTKNAYNYFSYLKTNGYHTENKMGANIGLDTIIGFIRKPDIITLHYLEMGENKELLYMFRDLLIKNLNSAEIKSYSVSDMLDLIEWRNIFKDTGTWVFKKHECKIFLKNEIEEIIEFNEARALYCMESLKDYERKIVFKYGKESDFIFQYNIIGGEYIHDKEFFNSAFHEITPIKNCHL